MIGRLLQNLLSSLNCLLILFRFIEFDKSPKERLLFAGQLLLGHDATPKCSAADLGLTKLMSNAIPPRYEENCYKSTRYVIKKNDK